jgi:aminoglycoside phosphotransferase (APT) family kinase protein
MEDVAGTPLELSSSQVEEHLRMVARALLKIHRCPVSVDKERDVEDRVKRLKRPLADIPVARPDLEKAVERCLKRIKKLSDELPAYEPTLVHGSLSTQEALLDGSELMILDLDKISLSDPALDVGNFLARIIWNGLRLDLPDEVVRHHALTFLSAYAPERPAHLRKRIDFYYRACVMKIARRASLAPEWQHLTVALLKEATEGAAVLAS